MQDELDRSHSRLQERRYALSGLSERKPLQELDWSYNTRLPERDILALGALRQYRALLKATELLVIDDLFLRRLPATAGDELADVLMSRYEKHFTIMPRIGEGGAAGRRGAACGDRSSAPVSRSAVPARDRTPTSAQA